MIFYSLFLLKRFFDCEKGLLIKRFPELLRSLNPKLLRKLRKRFSKSTPGTICKNIYSRIGKN